MFYFSQFPKVEYVIDSSGKTVTATDISKRFRIIQDVFKSKYVFYSYSVKEYETASQIAHKYYGNATLDWFIYLVNGVHDTYFDWPLSYNEFEQYMTEKYGSLQIAKQTVHEYYQIIQPREILFDGTVIQEYHITVDYSAYLLLADEDRSLISKYDWEKQVNEEKRTIKLVDKSFVPVLLQEMSNIFG